MSNWGLWRGGGKSETAGLVTADTSLITCATSATANTKGSYTELIASTAFDAVGFYCWPYGPSLDSGQEVDHSLVDLAIGAAASEIDILSNMSFCGEAVDGAGSWGAGMLYFPIAIPAGTRLSIRAQHSIAVVDFFGCQVILCGYSPFMPRQAGPAITYGVITGTSSGTALANPGTADNFGAWTELDASIARPIKLAYIYVTQEDDTTTRFGVELGVGAAASEITKTSEILSFAGARGGTSSPMCYGPIPVNIPAGTRLSARGRSNATARNPVVSVIGLG